MTSELFKAISIKALKNDFPLTLNAILAESSTTLPKIYLLLYELQQYSKAFKAENTTAMVKVVQLLQTELVEEQMKLHADTLLYFAKMLDVLGILKSAYAHVTVLTMISYKNAVDYHFPTPHDVPDDPKHKLHNNDVIKKTRIALLVNANSLLKLKEFCDNPDMLHSKWMNFHRNFQESARTLISKVIDLISKESIINIYDQKAWRAFRAYNADIMDDDETHMLYVEFIKNQASKTF